MVNISFHMIEMWTIRIRLSFKLTQWPLWILKWWWQQLEGTSRASSGFLCTRSEQGWCRGWFCVPSCPCQPEFLLLWAEQMKMLSRGHGRQPLATERGHHQAARPSGGQVTRLAEKILTGSSRLVCWCQVGVCAFSPMWALGCLPGPEHS